MVKFDSKAMHNAFNFAIVDQVFLQHWHTLFHSKNRLDLKKRNVLLDLIYSVFVDNVQINFLFITL